MGDMKTIPIQIKTEEFGPLIYRTKDGVTHFYQYYGIMQRMGDEHHDLHLVVEGCIKGDMCLWNVQHEYQLSEAESNDALMHYKIIATTNYSLHKERGIPLISDEIVRNYAYEDQNGGLKEVILETESVYVEPEGIHSNRGYFKDIPKLNEDGEVVMYHEPVKIVDWNQFSLDELIVHLEETFKFDSSGTAKAVHELISAYRGLKPKSEQELEHIFDKCAKKHMIVWNIRGFKRTYNRLFKSIMESLKIASNGGN